MAAPYPLIRHCLQAKHRKYADSCSFCFIMLNILSYLQCVRTRAVGLLNIQADALKKSKFKQEPDSKSIGLR